MLTSHLLSKKKEKQLQSKTQLVLDGNHLTTLDVFTAVFDFNLKVVITRETEERIETCRQTLRGCLKI